jgi:eukaryotic-like serine/threonine-protein kinase
LAADAAPVPAGPAGLSTADPAGQSHAARASAPARTVLTSRPTLTRTLPSVGGGGRFRLGPLGVAGVAIAAALVAALAVAIAMAPRGEPSAGGPGPTTSESTASATPTVPAGTVDAVRAAIAAVVAAGDLDGRSAQDLNGDLDSIERSLARGDFGKAADRIDDFQRRLTNLRRDDRLSDAGYAAIVATVNNLAATLPADGDGDGNGGDHGGGPGPG